MLPALTGEMVVGLWNSPAFRPALVRLIAGALPSEISCVRGAFIGTAARWDRWERWNAYAAAKVMHERMIVLLGAGLPEWIDVGHSDGCLCAALIVSQSRVASVSTIQRAITTFMSPTLLGVPLT